LFIWYLEVKPQCMNILVSDIENFNQTQLRDFYLVL
jgi:hypothetical protein